MKRIFTVLAFAFVSAMAVICSSPELYAGELQKPQIKFLQRYYVQQYLVFSFLLQNVNASYALGTVYWNVRILKNAQQVFATSGQRDVGKSETVEVQPQECYTPTEAGDYTVEVTANSEVNITGEQMATGVVNVLPASSECPPPTRTPAGNLVVIAEGNTITYTAPAGCCYRITPFINTGVWYSMSPSGTQTISDGQSATFTLTAKDAKPGASVVAFQWTECTKGTPSGKDYIVVSPIRLYANDTINNSPYGPGVYMSTFGDPVSTSSGQFTLNNGPDIQFAVAKHLNFTHNYDGQFLNAGFFPGLGLNWQHTYSSHLVMTSDYCYAQMSDGRRMTFAKGGSAWFGQGKSSVYNLQQKTSSWIMTDVTNKMQYTFDANGRLIKVDDGSWPVYITWNNANIVSATDSLSHTLTFTTDSLGKISRVTDGIESVLFAYSAAGELVSFTATSGAVTNYSYDAAVPGRLTQVALQGVNTPLLTMEYDAQGRVVRQTNSLGSIWSYSYETNKATMTDPDGYVEVHDMNVTGKVTALGPVDEQVSLIYNGQEFPTEVHNAKGGTIKVKWHMSGMPETIENVDGITKYEYVMGMWNGSVIFDLSKVTYPDNSTEEYQYNGNGHLIGIKDRMMHQWTYTVDPKTGQRTQQTDPLGRTVSTAYDSKGHVQSVTMPSGLKTTFGTNASGNVSLITNNDQSTRRFEYDAVGRLTKTTDELGQATSFTYNNNNVHTKLVTASNATYSFKYDVENRLVSSTMPTGGEYTFRYSDGGRLEAIHDPANMAITFAYDASGNKKSETNRLGDATAYSYDVDGNLISAMSPEGNITHYTYDLRGRIASVETPAGITSTNTYNSNGQLSAYTELSGRSHSFLFDEGGMLSQNTVGDILTAKYVFDASGAVTKVTDPEGNDWNYSYDYGGRLQSIADPAGRTLTYSYDNRDRVSSIKLPGQTGNGTMLYDAAGNLLRMQFTDGTDISFAYDNEGRIVKTNNDTCAFNADGNIVYSNGISMQRNANGWITKISFAPGKDVAYTYDAAGRLTAVQDWMSGAMLFTHDKDGGLTSVQRPNGITTTYQRNADGRITKITEGSIATTEVSYGNSSQIRSVSRTGHLEPSPQKGEWTATYDAGNTKTDVAYDDMGRTVIAADDSLLWDAASRLKQAYSNGVGDVETDGFGRIVNSTAFGPAWSIKWNDAFGDGLPGSVTVANQTWIVVPTPGGTVAYVINQESGARLFPHYTESGNTSLVTNDQGTVVLSVAYEPYGKVLDMQGNAPYPFLFGGVAGVIRLTNSLYAMPGRIYDASAGRFTTPDPVRSHHPMRINPFQYAQCDPVNWHDWTGRAPEPAPRSADEIVEASNRRLEDAMRQTQERYEEAMRKNEEAAARRRAQREAEEKANREARERLEQQQRDEEERLRKDKEAFDRALAKAEELNEIFTPMPTHPCTPDEAPATGENTSTPGEQNAGSNPGGNGQPPAPGGTRVRPPKPKTSPANSGNGNSGGTNGGQQQPAPGGRGSQGGLGAGQNPYGTFFPPTIYVIGAGIEGFFEGFFNPWDSYWKDVFN